MASRKVDANQPTYVYKSVVGTQVVVRAGENGVTDLDIRELNLAHNREVENDYKNARPKRTKEEKATIQAWMEHYISNIVAEYGYQPHPLDVKAEVNDQFPRNYTLSLKAFDDECEEGKNPIQKAMADSFVVDEDPRIERLHEILPLLTEDQRWLINQIYVEGRTQPDIAKELGKTQQSISKRLAKIHNRLKKLF